MAIQDDTVHEVSGKRRLQVASAEALNGASGVTINLFTYLFVEISGREVGLKPVLRILVGIVVCEATLLLHLVIFIVSGIDDDRWVMADALDLRNTLGLD